MASWTNPNPYAENMRYSAAYSGDVKRAAMSSARQPTMAYSSTKQTRGNGVCLPISWVGDADELKGILRLNILFDLEVRVDFWPNIKEAYRFPGGGHGVPPCTVVRSPRM